MTSIPERLDVTFAALADPTRRAILARLASGEASVMELAEPFAMSQPAISKHLKVLERAGLISTGSDAQRRPRKLEAKPLAEATAWLEEYRQFWEASFGRLDELLQVLKAGGEKIFGHTRAPARYPQEKITQETMRRVRMRFADTFKVTLPSDREIQVSRTFNAPRDLIFDALTKPELVRQWLLGPEGWTMPVCKIDARVGGSYRYLWRFESSGKEMGMGGVFLDVLRPARIVATEKFDESWYPGEALDTTTLVEKDGMTTLTITVLYESQEARDIATRSGMERGMAAGYDRLEQLLHDMPAQAPTLSPSPSPK